MKMPKLFGERMYRFVGESGNKANQAMHELHRVVMCGPDVDAITPEPGDLVVVTWGEKRMSWLGSLADFWRQFEEVPA